MSATLLLALVGAASASNSAFCDFVHINHGCCPACGYRWAAKDGACVTTQPARSAYCNELKEPAHGGCCEYCQYTWSKSEAKCVQDTTALPMLPMLPTPPNASDHVATARWMASTLTWGVLSTISTRSDGSTPGDAFGNPNSFADVGGVPYIYGAAMDASFVDIFTGKARASLALSEASLMDKDGVATIADCKIGAGTFGDPENPPCARLVLSGAMVRLNATDREEAPAKAALFKRHPSFKAFPSGHDFFVAKLEIDSIWLIDAYGGASIIDPADYFKGSPAVHRPAVVAAHSEAIAAVEAAPPPQSAEKRGRKLSHAKTARGLVSELTWGVLSTVSTRSDGATVGDAFGNPYSFADVGGAPYVFASDMDASMIDLFGKGGKPRANLALSEASLPGKHSLVWKEKCQIGTPLGDPENPPCARLVLSGNLTKLADGSAEAKTAMAALVKRHPSFASYPSSHGFYVAKLELDGIWLIDFFGGAAVVDPADYFKA